ncbi:hypothetical protein [Flavobacterium johnsoniae]|uniref:Uncharacterized protein n=1 Tax=Flavobacterium johnsoniae TaxID=986 RepID=A0A1J7CFL7_FLAJO|nr:hypothetical protein [Flavobacterium johnsoniae]OIV40328.1 hypothetical protein BKM63_20540 [Flavobacterium johnsoniae]
MDLEHANRLEIEAAQRDAAEERLRKLFPGSPSAERSLLGEKLRWSENMLAKYKHTHHPQERAALQIIKNERRGILRKLYPNPLAYFLYKILRVLILEKAQAAMHRREELKNRSYLEEKLSEAGFREAFEKTRRYMALGQIKFTVPVSYYLNETQRADHSLYFKKDARGYYRFEGFTARLYDSGQPFAMREHYFDAAEKGLFSAVKACNLLSGRAVFDQGSWKQFDLERRDADGNYPVKEFRENYGWDIEKEVSALPLKIPEHLQGGSLIECLKQGGRQDVILVGHEKQRRVFIEAAPQYKTLVFYNENLKKIPRGRVQAAGREREAGLQRKSPHQQTAPVLKARGRKKSL